MPNLIKNSKSLSPYRRNNISEICCRSNIAIKKIFPLHENPVLLSDYKITSTSEIPNWKYHVSFDNLKIQYL
jgi:hypothetical protein